MNYQNLQLQLDIKIGFGFKIILQVCKVSDELALIGCVSGRLHNRHKQFFGPNETRFLVGGGGGFQNGRLSKKGVN